MNTLTVVEDLRRVTRNVVEVLKHPLYDPITGVRLSFKQNHFILWGYDTLLTHSRTVTNFKEFDVALVTVNPSVLPIHAKSVAIRRIRKLGR